MMKKIIEPKKNVKAKYAKPKVINLDQRIEIVGAGECGSPCTGTTSTIQS
jgi:hypothetical protein